MPNIMPEFDEAGNAILTKPPKIEELEEELEEIINGKVEVSSYSWVCQFCESEWKSKNSRERHEAWCKENPNGRKSYRKPVSTPKAKKSKKSKNGAKLGRPPKTHKSKDIIKELKEFDKVFGLTDEQIAKYIRGLMK